MAVEGFVAVQDRQLEEWDAQATGTCQVPPSAGVLSWS